MQTCLSLSYERETEKYCYFIVSCCETKVCPKMWFTLKLGWLKISAKTNIGPQNNTYMSVPKHHSQQALITQWTIKIQELVALIGQQQSIISDRNHLEPEG